MTLEEPNRASRSPLLEKLDILTECVDYRPETGEFFWKHRRLEFFPSERIANGWNTRYSGKPIKSKDGNGYIRISINGEFCPAHVAAWFIFYRQRPSMMVDHVNRNITDNRICNLRLLDHRGNAINSNSKQISASGFRGVYKSRRRWIAKISINGINQYLGSFESKDAARDAYDGAMSAYLKELGMQANG